MKNLRLLTLLSLAGSLAFSADVKNAPKDDGNQPGNVKQVTASLPNVVLCMADKDLSEPMQHYFGCISAMDEQRQQLRDLGIQENTLLVFSSDNGPCLWFSGSVPKREDGTARHSGQVYGEGDPISWISPSEVVNLYEVRGRWTDGTETKPVVKTPPGKMDQCAQFSGIYPHLAMFNTVRPCSLSWLQALCMQHKTHVSTWAGLISIQ